MIEASTDFIKNTPQAGSERTSKRILVLGMGCSGTSFVTRFLCRSGVFPGEVTKKYEHKISYEIDYPIFESFGAKDGLPYGRLPANEIEVDQAWHDKVLSFAKEMDVQAAALKSQYWIYKDPRATVLSSLWTPYFDVIVGVFRSPKQVAHSYISKKWIRGWWKEKTAFQYWIRFNRALVQVHDQNAGKKPFYLIDYNGDLISQLSALCRTLGFEPSQEAIQDYDSSRHRRMVSLPNNEEIKELYESLQRTRSFN